MNKLSLTSLHTLGRFLSPRALGALAACGRAPACAASHMWRALYLHTVHRLTGLDVMDLPEGADAAAEFRENPVLVAFYSARAPSPAAQRWLLSTMLMQTPTITQAQCRSLRAMYDTRPDVVHMYPADLLCPTNDRDAGALCRVLEHRVPLRFDGAQQFAQTLAGLRAQTVELMTGGYKFVALCPGARDHEPVQITISVSLTCDTVVFCDPPYALAPLMERIGVSYNGSYLPISDRMRMLQRLQRDAVVWASLFPTAGDSTGRAVLCAMAPQEFDANVEWYYRCWSTMRVLSGSDVGRYVATNDYQRVHKQMRLQRTGANDLLRRQVAHAFGTGKRASWWLSRLQHHAPRMERELAHAVRLRGTGAFADACRHAQRVLAKRGTGMPGARAHWMFTLRWCKPHGSEADEVVLLSSARDTAARTRRAGYIRTGSFDELFAQVAGWHCTIGIRATRPCARL